MNLTAKFGFKLTWKVVWAAGLFLMLALCVALLDRAASSSRGSHHTDTRASLSATGGTAISESTKPSEVKNYFMDFDG